jgi:hypothetical protein
MNTEFVPHEPSLALKELGFDEPCLGYWKSKNWLIQEKTRTDGYTHADQECSAPLYQQAFRWFREKYNLKSWVQEHTADTFIYEIRPHVLTQYKQGETYVYTNYEEAELACLKKLIEIVKQ